MGPILPWGTNLRAAQCLERVLHPSSCIPGEWACQFHLLESHPGCPVLRPSARIPYDILTAGTPSAAQWPFSNQELFGNSHKCGLVATAPPGTLRSKAFSPQKTMLGASNLCFKKPVGVSLCTLEFKNLQKFQRLLWAKGTAHAHTQRVNDNRGSIPGPPSSLILVCELLSVFWKTVDKGQFPVILFHSVAYIKLSTFLRAFFCFPFFSGFCL